MVSKGEHQKIIRMLNTIHQRGNIHKWDLIDEVKISIRDYNVLVSYMKHKYKDVLSYDSKTGEWSYNFGSKQEYFEAIKTKAQYSIDDTDGR